MLWRWLADMCIPARIAPTVDDRVQLFLEGLSITAAAMRLLADQASTPPPPLEGTELAVYIRTQQGNQLVGRVVHMGWMH